MLTLLFGPNPVSELIEEIIKIQRNNSRLPKNPHVEEMVRNIENEPTQINVMSTDKNAEQK